jgi:hypothetical protein
VARRATIALGAWQLAELLLRYPTNLDNSPAAGLLHRLRFLYPVPISLHWIVRRRPNACFARHHQISVRGSAKNVAFREELPYFASETASISARQDHPVGPNVGPPSCRCSPLWVVAHRPLSATLGNIN